MYRLAILSPPLVGQSAPNDAIVVAYAISDHAGVCEANARLIAKAPELLIILRLFIEGKPPTMGILKQLLLDIERGQ